MIENCSFDQISEIRRYVHVGTVERLETRS